MCENSIQIMIYSNRMQFINSNLSFEFEWFNLTVLKYGVNLILNWTQEPTLNNKSHMFNADFAHSTNQNIC